MAQIFLLGPSEWVERRHGVTPMDLRRKVAHVLRDHGHSVIIMEDEQDIHGYLTSLARLGITAIPWNTAQELRDRAGLLAAELA